MGSQYKEISGFHSQQCAEMAIKGLLAFNQIRFSKTHDLERLAGEVKQLDHELARSILRSAKPMTDLAVAYRYPDANSAPLTTRKEKKSAIDHLLSNWRN